MPLDICFIVVANIGGLYKGIVRLNYKFAIKFRHIFHHILHVFGFYSFWFLPRDAL